MADGYESSRSDEYFNGGMRDRPIPRRIKDDGKAADEAHSKETQSPAPEK